MVTVTRATIESTAPADVEGWVAALAPGRQAPAVEILRRASRFAAQAHAGQQRASGEPYVYHAFAVARILAQLELNHEAIAAAILHDVVEDTDVTLVDIRREFGERVATLV